MKNIVGIDLGTTYSAISRLNEIGKPEICPFEGTERLIASTIYFDDEKTLVGDLARNKSNIDSTKYFELIKRYMGENFVPDKLGQPRKINDKVLTPSELSGIILKKIKEEFELQFGKIDQAIITVPAYFDESRRQATMNAAKFAGLNVSGIINEPTAAGLYYSTIQNLSGKILVFDLGGGTFDVTSLNVKNVDTKIDIEIITSQGDHKLGGKDFDNEILKDINNKYLQKYGKEFIINQEKANYLMIEAEKIKRELSKVDNAQRSFLGNEGQLDYSLSRTDFENMISPFFSKIEMLIENVVEDSKLKYSDFDHLILVGGSSRIPYVVNTLENLFKKSPTRVGNLDESVSLGATIYCGIQAMQSEGKGIFTEQARENLDNINMVDVTNHSFGAFMLEFDSDVNQYIEINDIIIPKNTKLPAEVTKTYYTVSDNQTALEISITQGESKDRNMVDVLKEKEMPLPGGRRRGQPIEVTYAYDKNGMMKCVFFDVKSGRRETLDLNLNNSNDSQFDIDDVVNF